MQSRYIAPAALLLLIALLLPLAQAPLFPASAQEKPAEKEEGAEEKEAPEGPLLRVRIDAVTEQKRSTRLYAEKTLEYILKESGIHLLVVEDPKAKLTELEPAADLIVKGSSKVWSDRQATFYGQDLVYVYGGEAEIKILDGKTGEVMFKKSDLSGEQGKTSRRKARKAAERLIASLIALEVAKSDPVRELVPADKLETHDEWVAGREKALQQALNKGKQEGDEKGPGEPEPKPKNPPPGPF